MPKRAKHPGGRPAPEFPKVQRCVYLVRELDSAVCSIAEARGLPSFSDALTRLLLGELQLPLELRRKLSSTASASASSARASAAAS